MFFNTVHCSKPTVHRQCYDGVYLTDKTFMFTENFLRLFIEFLVQLLFVLSPFFEERFMFFFYLLIQANSPRNKGAGLCPRYPF